MKKVPKEDLQDCGRCPSVWGFFLRRPLHQEEAYVLADKMRALGHALGSTQVQFSGAKPSMSHAHAMPDGCAPFITVPEGSTRTAFLGKADERRGDLVEVCTK